MEENKISIFEDQALIEGETSTIDKNKGKKRLGSYMLITVSFFIFIIACIFSETGYSLINSDKNIYSEELFSTFGAENDPKDSYPGYILRKFLGVGKIYGLEKVKETVSNSDEQPNDTEQIEALLPIETEAEKPAETQIKDTTAPESETKYPVISLDLSQKQLGENYIVNETGYTPDIEKLRNSSEGIEALAIDSKNLPSVLIIHTHGTESYLDEEKNYYTEKDGEISRTKDKEKNVVKIGKIITDMLNEAGIKTIHCDILHDEESYQDSYTRAAESIKSYLAKYPSIKYVFDIHRDAILKSDGSLVKAVTKIDGESSAQIMTVIGSNYKGANFPDWERNLSVALKLKKLLDDENDTFSRPVYLRGAAYNQQYAPCSLLLEIGTSGNTLKEAEKAAEIAAKALIKLIEDLSIEH